MQVLYKTLHDFQKKIQKSTAAPSFSGTAVNCRRRSRLFRSLNGSLAEVLEILHQVQGGLTGTGASSFVTLNYLSVSIDYEFCVLSFDFLDKLFHD